MKNCGIIFGMNNSTIKNEDLGLALAKARQNAGFSQLKVADFLGADYKTISAYEKGRRRIPGVYLLRLAKELNVSLDELLGMEFPKIDGRTRKASALKILDEIENFSQEDEKVILGMVDSIKQKYSIPASI